jgi:hypothetical protein
MRAVPQTSTASGLRGYWFIFHEDGHTFAHWAGPVTGKEEVYLDGQLVSESRKFSLKSSHTIQTAQALYSMSLRSPSISSAAVECTLSKNNTPLAQSIARYESNMPKAARFATIAAVAGTLYAQYKLRLPLSLTAAALIAIGATAITIALKRGRYTIGPVSHAAEAEA